MAEQEIAKHTRNILSLLDTHPQDWRHRLSDFLLEAATIVFAVSLSIWLHSLVEHRHEQEQVRSFLLGLRHDLRTDIEMIQKLSTFYHEFDTNFTYLGQLHPGMPVDTEKFREAYETADHNIFFNSLTSRYQGFKSAGRLGNIENEALLEKILNLYERLTDEIKSSENGWRRMQNNYRAYLETALSDDDSTARHYQLLTSPKGKRLLRSQIASSQLYDRYNHYVALCNEIIKEIERQYPAYIND